MNNRNLHTLRLATIAALATALLTIACQRQAGNAGKSQMKMAETDTLVYKAMNVDYNRALLVVDSLEDIGALSEAKLCFYRAQIHFKMGQELSAELYYKKALSTNEIYRDHTPPTTTSPTTSWPPSSPSRATSRGHWPPPQRATASYRATRHPWGSIGRQYCSTT